MTWNYFHTYVQHVYANFTEKWLGANTLPSKPISIKHFSRQAVMNAIALRNIPTTKVLSSCVLFDICMLYIPSTPCRLWHSVTASLNCEFVHFLIFSQWPAAILSIQTRNNQQGWLHPLLRAFPGFGRCDAQLHHHTDVKCPILYQNLKTCRGCVWNELSMFTVISSSDSHIPHLRKVQEKKKSPLKIQWNFADEQN